MAIKNGQLADADEVMNALGKIFHNQAQIAYEQLYEGYTSKPNTTNPDFDNASFDAFMGDTMTATDMFYDSTDDLYVGPLLDNEADADFTTIDECNDSSINATIWTQVGDGSFSEDTSKLIVTGAGGTADYVRTAQDLVSTYSAYIRVRVQCPSSNTNTGNVWIGGVTTNIFTIPKDDTWYTVDILYLGNVVYVYDSSSATWVRKGTDSEHKISIGNGGSAGDKTYIDWIRYWNFGTDTFSATPQLVQTTATTASSTVTNLILTYNYTNVEPSTVQVSADNGVNFENVTKSQIHRPTNTGTQLKTKYIWSGTSSDVFALTSQGIIWNLY